MSSSDSVYIAISRDGIYGSRTYQGSGLMTSRILFSAFTKRLRRTEIGPSYQSFDDALGFALKGGFKYVVYPLGGPRHRMVGDP
jgi:hypothetical protein